MSETTIIIYGSDWCPDCRRAKRYLMDHSIPFSWIDVEKDCEAEQIVLKLNRGMRSIPTIVFADGSTLTEPSNQQLARKLGVPR